MNNDDLKIAKIIEEAIIKGKKVKLSYVSSYDYSMEEYTERVVIPLGIYTGAELNTIRKLEEGDWIEDKIYIKAFCELRNDERTFRADRIKDIEIL